MNKKLTYSSIVAAIYAALTMLVAPISFGILQLRLSEGLCLLPLIMPESILGLTIGCLITNAWGVVFGFNPLGIFDVFLGTLATFFGALLTSKIKKMPYAAIPPILLNMIIIGSELTFAESGKILSKLLIINMSKILVEETICVLIIGIPLYKLVNNVLQNTKKK